MADLDQDKLHEAIKSLDEQPIPTRDRYVWHPEYGWLGPFDMDTMEAGQ